MTQRKNDVPHRRVFKKVHGRSPKPGYHVHHIDGNHQNNDPSNLIEVSAKDHYDIHRRQNDYGACIMLSSSAQVSPEELADIQRLHGLKCAANKIGIHSDDRDRKSHLANIWRKTPPGRMPVTNGVDILKFKTEEEREAFLRIHVDWRKGYPERIIKGLEKSTRRISSEESKILAQKRLAEGSHNFVIEYTCPCCGTIGKGPMMKRWHFDKCKRGIK